VCSSPIGLIGRVRSSHWQTVRARDLAAPWMSTTSRLMFITAGAGLAFARAAAAAAAERPFKRLYLSRRLRSSTPAEHDPARAARPGQPGKDGALSVDFEQTQRAHKSKDSLELLRSLVVFKLCSYDILVEKNTEVTRPFDHVHEMVTNYMCGVQL